MRQMPLPGADGDSWEAEEEEEGDGDDDDEAGAAAANAGTTAPAAAGTACSGASSSAFSSASVVGDADWNPLTLAKKVARPHALSSLTLSSFTPRRPRLAPPSAPNPGRAEPPSCP